MVLQLRENPRIRKYYMKTHLPRLLSAHLTHFSSRQKFDFLPRIHSNIKSCFLVNSFSKCLPSFLYCVLFYKYAYFFKLTDCVSKEQLFIITVRCALFPLSHTVLCS